MALLTKAVMQVTHAKANLYGETGGGKTTLLAMLLIHLSKTYHSGAPVAMMSTEPGVDYVIPIFEKEGVELMLHRSKSFGDLISVAKEAIAAKVCAFGVDSLTHVWTELSDSYMKSKNRTRLEFQDWKAIKGTGGGWADWTELFINSRIHMITTGRAGFEYENEEKEDGTRELIKGDSKMKAEGEFGYEADLLLELSRTTDKHELRRIKKAAGRAVRADLGSSTLLVQHHALVKKCRVWDLNDKQFNWASAKEYKPGYYKEVGGVFAPYFDFLAKNRAALNGSATPNTASIVDTSRHTAHATGPTNGDYFKKKKLLDDWIATMAMLFPGSATKAAKHAQQVIGETVSTVRGMESFKAMDVSAMGFSVDVLHELEEMVKHEGTLSKLPELEDKDLISLCELAREMAGGKVRDERLAEDKEIAATAEQFDIF